MNHEITFPAQSATLGGVALSPDCKYGLILSKVNSGGSLTDSFQVIFVYLDENGDFQTTNGQSSILLWSASLGSTIEMFSTLVSDDRSILVYNSSNFGASQGNILVNSSVFDVFENKSLKTGETGACANTYNCDVSASIFNGRRVDVELNGSNLYDAKIE